MRSGVQIVSQVQPTVMISCTSSPNSLRPITEAAVRAMTRHAPRPIIFALSSPTPELSAAQAYHWSDGKAMYANYEGAQEEVSTPEGQILTPSKVQSVYVFPGLALGTCVTRCGLLLTRTAAVAARQRWRCIPFLETQTHTKD